MCPRKRVNSRHTIDLEVGKGSQEIPPGEWSENVEGTGTRIVSVWNGPAGSGTKRRRRNGRQRVLASRVEGGISGTSEGREEALKTGSRTPNRFPFFGKKGNRFWETVFFDRNGLGKETELPASGQSVNGH